MVAEHIVICLHPDHFGVQFTYVAPVVLIRLYCALGEGVAKQTAVFSHWEGLTVITKNLLTNFTGRPADGSLMAARARPAGSDKLEAAVFQHQGMLLRALVQPSKVALQHLFWGHVLTGPAVLVECPD